MRAVRMVEFNPLQLHRVFVDDVETAVALLLHETLEHAEVPDFALFVQVFLHLVQHLAVLEWEWLEVWDECELFLVVLLDERFVWFEFDDLSEVFHQIFDIVCNFYFKFIFLQLF